MTIQAFAQNNATVNGWTVTYKGVSNPTSSSTMVSYDLCPANNSAGSLNVVSLGVPSCFPQFSVTAVSPATALTVDQDPSNGVYGIVWRNLHLTTCQTFSYTVAGNFSAIDAIDVGVSTTNPCNACNISNGASGILSGLKCEVKGNGVCGDIARADISMMFEQSSCISKTGADNIRTAAMSLVQDFSSLRETPRIAIGSFNYGKNSVCDTTGWPSGYSKPYLKDYARYISLLNGTATTSVTAWDYDGFLQRTYGIPGLSEATSTNTYRALLGFANQSPYTCGASPMDAAFDVSDRHITTVYGSGYQDPQTDNYVVLVSTGRPSQYGSTTCSNACDCAQARNAAKEKRDLAVSHGVKVVAVYFDDAACSCTAAQVQAGKDFLKTQIASDPSMYFESNASTINSVLKTVKNQRLTQTVTCDQSQFAGSCGATCDTNMAGGTCKPIACNVPITPLPQCGATDITPILLALDQQDFNSTARVSQASRLLRDAFISNPKTLARNNAISKKAVNQAKQQQNSNWTTIWSIPAQIKTCPSVVTCNRQDATVKVSAATSGFNNILSLANSLINRLPKTLPKALRLRRTALNNAIARDAALFAKSSALLPDLSAICS